MKKIDLFLDFDETMTKSIKQFIKIANKKFNVNKDWKDLRLWNFVDLYPNITLNDINEIFCSEDFFIDLEFHEGVIETLEKLKDNLNIHIATLGLDDNLDKKQIFLKNKIKEINYNFVGVLDKGKEELNDKSCVDMSNSIFIDDRVTNLRNSNANIKILFKDYRHYYWQEVEPNDNIYIVNSWEEIYDILKFFIEHKEMLQYE